MTNFDYYDEELFDIAYKIERFGYTTFGVNTGKCSVPGCDCPPPQGPPWFYSIGMLEHGHSEIVIVGDVPVHPCELFAFAFEHRHEGQPLPFGRGASATAAGATFTTIAIPRRCWADSSLVAYWHNYYRSVGWPAIDVQPAPFVQLVIADAAGRFPWDDGCDPTFAAAQPILADDDSAWPRENRAARRASERSQQRRRKRGR